MYPSEGKKPRPMGRLLPTLPRPAHEGPDLSGHKLGEPLNIAQVARLIGCSTWTPF